MKLSEYQKRLGTVYVQSRVQEAQLTRALAELRETQYTVIVELSRQGLSGMEFRSELRAALEADNLPVHF